MLERVKASYLPYADSWIDESETIAIIGEAAHPLPVSYFPVFSPFAQLAVLRAIQCKPCGMPSATLVLEEASFLSILFSHLRYRAQIASFLYAFEDFRRPRTHALREVELANISILSLLFGPDRKARDDTWREQKKAFVNREIGKVSGSTRGDVGCVGSGGEHDFGDTSSEAENQEMLRKWQRLFAIWGYDTRDAAEIWWVEWAILGERALGMDTMRNGAEVHAHYETEISRGMNGLWFHNVEVVVSHS